MVTPPIVDESCLIVAMATEWAGLSSGEPLDGSETVSVEDVRAGEDYLWQRGRESRANNNYCNKKLLKFLEYFSCYYSC